MKGFILTQDWQDRSGSCVLLFVGRGEDGTFELQVRSRPVLFVRRDAELPPEVQPAERRQVELRNFADQPVDALYFTTQWACREARDALRQLLITVFEGDVAPADRYLMERFIHGGVEVEGEAVEESGVTVYTNPRVKAAEYAPQLSTLSLDIETGRNGELYSIAYQFRRGHEEVLRVYVAGEDDSRVADFCRQCADEATAIQLFLEDLEHLDPDILLGWHVVGFDLQFLHKKCQEHQIPFRLGRRQTEPRFTERGSSLFVHVHGRVVIDGPPALRAAFYTFEDFTLNTVAHEVLGRTKDIEEHGEAKIAEIKRRYLEDKNSLAYYNLLDCRLVTDIFAKLELIELILNRVQISGMLIDRQGRSVGAFDHFYLPRLHRKGYVAPDAADTPPGQHAAGGLVLSPRPGLHEHVALFDFKSLYPSVIRTFKIDPLSRVRREVDPVETPVGTQFSRTEHILPDYVAGLLEKRDRAKHDGNRPLDQAIKILMNSFYGVMGTQNCRFYHYDLPNSVTGTGQWVLSTAKEQLERMGYEVLYGDTDSLFVQLKPSDTKDPHAAAEKLVALINEFFRESLARDFLVESALELEFEKHYRKLFLPSMRGREEGAAKRYAGLLMGPGGEETLEFTGLEIVRSDWTQLAKQFQYELYRRFFNQQELPPWIRSIVEAVKGGKFDDLLVYRKRLRKAVSEYTKSTPPHVRAALLLPVTERQNLRDISYVMTLRGPVPLDLPHEDIDYAYYIEHQIKPLADQVLPTLGTSFDEITGDTQLSLF